MTLLPAYLCALTLLAGPVAPRSSPGESPGLRPTQAPEDEEFDAVWRGFSDYVAALARVVRAQPGIDEPARQALAALLDRYESWNGGGTPLAWSEIAAAFEKWALATQRLPAEQRSDALLMADRVMDALSLYGAPAVPAPEGGSLQFAGAEFHYSVLGGGYVYAHTFLGKARDAAPPGAARDRVALREMEVGFDFDGMCSAGDDVTDRVIAAGEGLLRRSKDRRVLASAHLMIADAHATVVMLAHGEATEYFDASAYRPRERAARREAIAHYRAGLAIDPSPPDAQLLRRDLRLLQHGATPRLAGGAGRKRVFYCVYD